MLALLACSLFVPKLVHAQVAQSSIGGGHSLWVGGEYSNMQAGFPYGSGLRLSGVGAFATYNWSHRLGVEGEARFLHFNSYYGETENNFLVGPRYTFLSRPKLRPYVTLQIGEVGLKYPFALGSDRIFAMAPGGGVEYRLGGKWSLRGEYEYQILPNSPNYLNEPKYGVRPDGLNLGISYRLPWLR